MKAIVIEPGVSNSLSKIDVPDPHVGEEDVLVRVVRVGVCGTDQELRAGSYGEAPQGSPQLVVGHEALGQVVDLGSRVQAFVKGDYVVASVRRPCPHDRCSPCRTGQNDMCITGDFVERGIKGRHGFMAEYYSEQGDLLTRIPSDATGVGVLLEPLSIVEKAMRQTTQIQGRLPWTIENALVLGAGTIGLLGATLLRLRGINTYVLDRSKQGGFKSSIITQIGGHHVDSTTTTVSELAADRGPFDLILEASGYAPLVFEALEQLALDGVLCLLGISGESGEVPVAAGKFNNRFVLGNRLVFGSVNANQVDFQAGVQHLEQINSQWPGLLDSFLTRRVPFDSFEEAYERQPGDVKVVIELSDT